MTNEAINKLDPSIVIETRMAGQSSLPFSSKQLILPRFRSAPRFIIYVACYGVFTICGWVSNRPNSCARLLAGCQINVHYQFNILFSMAWEACRSLLCDGPN